MTVSSTTRKAGPYIGTGVVDTYGFEFKVFKDTDVVVVRTDLAGVETTLTLHDDYSVTLSPNQDTAPGGSITLSANLEQDFLLTLTSDVPILQSLDLTNQGGFHPAVINAALDRLTIQCQQLAEQLSRSIKLGISDPTPADEYRDALLQSAADAIASASAAAASETAAGASQVAAAASQAAALASQLAAALSETSASASKNSIDISEAHIVLLEAATLANKLASDSNAASALASKAAAALSEVNAKASETAAASSETNAGVSEVNAKASEDTARTFLESLTQPFAFYKSDYNSPCLLKTGGNTVSIKAGTVVVVNGVSRVFAVNTPVSMPALVIGSDYSVWVNPDNSAQAVLDMYSSKAVAPVPGAKKIGGFHYSLVAWGTTPATGLFATTGFTASGGNMIWTQSDVDRIAGVNEFTFWDLAFRCKGEQRGMSLIPEENAFLAIYFCSTNHIVNGISAYNTDIASGTVLPRIPLAFGGDGTMNYATLGWYQIVEIYASFGLRPPTYEEFMLGTWGVTEGQSLGGAASTVPATLRQPGYTSRTGIEQATGHQYAAGPFHSVGGSAWAGVGRGSFYGTTGFALFGGGRNDTGNSGSRSGIFGYAPSNSFWYISPRAAGDLEKTVGPALYVDE